MEDAEGRAHPIFSAEYQIKRADGTVAKRAMASGTATAQMEVTGMDSGNYTLYVTASSSYQFTFQVPFVIKYDDENTNP